MGCIELTEAEIDPLFTPLWDDAEIAVVTCTNGNYHGIIRIVGDPEHRNVVHPDSFDDPEECRRITARDWATVEFQAAKVIKGEVPIIESE